MLLLLKVSHVRGWHRITTNLSQGEGWLSLAFDGRRGACNDAARHMSLRAPTTWRVERSGFQQPLSRSRTRAASPKSHES